jgi:cytochrome c-type biogenesis protein CcmE
MKKTHVVILILVAVTAAVLIARTGDYTTYANFLEAKEKGKSVNVVGYLAKDKEMVYDPQKDPNFFSFIMADKEGNECKVVYKGSKPQDFERSEQVVVKGKMNGEVFACSEISMKCPSKYVNDKITLKEGEVKDGEVTVKSNL